MESYQSTEYKIQQVIPCSDYVALYKDDNGLEEPEYREQINFLAVTEITYRHYESVEQACNEEEPYEIEEDKEYTITTTSFLAQGGDGYTVFTQGIEVEETSMLLRDLEIDYIKNKIPVFAKVQGRLINVSFENSSK